MSCHNTTHKLRTTVLGSQTTRTWYKLSDGREETDVDVLAALEASLLENCEGCKDVNCVESQEWTYGIDNTGTSFREDNTIRITLSDGTSFEYNQPPTTGWTPQMELWGQEIQQAADNAGIKWFVETRFRNASNPADLSGGGGFSGPPSLVVSNALTNMLWRYVNIQICPGQPVPVDGEIIASSNPARVGTKLTTNGAVKGPLQRFFVCRECGKEPVWYLDDGITLAEAGQIPNCFEPCGVLSQLPSPPENDCTFEIDVACDSNGSTNTVDFTNTITRRATVCNGEQIAVDYFQADPNDANALIPYDLVGEFVDCASGEPLPLPPVSCEESVYAGLLYRLNESATSELTVDWWAGDNYEPNTSAPHDNVTNIFTVSADGRTLEHVNGAPSFSFTQTDTNVNTGSNAFAVAVEGTRDQTSGTDQLRIRGYVNLQEPALLRDTNNNTGERGGIWINKCCAGSLELLFEDTTDSVAGDTSIFDGVLIPAGIHYIEVATSDLSAWQGFELSASFDDGATYNPLEIYSSKPKYDCIALVRCVDTGLLLDRNTGEVIEIRDTDLNCPPFECQICCKPEPQPAVIDEQALAEAIVRKQRDVTPRMYGFVNEGDIVDLGLPAGTMGTIVSVEDVGTGFVRWTIDGTSPQTAGNNSTFTTTGPYHSGYRLQNVDLSLVRFDASSDAADFFVMVEIYN